jgi:hypothetical protein
MTDHRDVSMQGKQGKEPDARLRLVLLVLVHIAVCCLSFAYVTHYYGYVGLFAFDPAQLGPAVLNVAPLAAASILFAISRFSFGYFVGFGFYTVILGYLWLASVSLLAYDHRLGSISALTSILAFLAPALFLTAPMKQRVVLSRGTLDLLLSLILIVAVVVLATGVLYNFHLVGVSDIYKFRSTLDFPLPERYAVGIVLGALLPFAFACHFMRGQWWRASASLLLMVSFYPITLAKLALFAPVWLLFLALLARWCEARVAVVLSLLLLITAGVVMQSFGLFGLAPTEHAINYFGAVNFRMIAVPSIVLDLYGDFFSAHRVTHFCQIVFLKPFVACPYDEPLAAVMSQNYPLGSANASLFATEGFASVGLTWAPLATFACGLIIGLGNRLSAGLPPKFILLSSGILLQVFMNVPLSTSLLSNGAALLFLLWYVTPREMFKTTTDARRCA